MLSSDWSSDVVSSDLGVSSDYAGSPDSRGLAFSVRIAGTTEPLSTNYDIYRVPADGSSAAVNLTAKNLAWDAGPVYSADGKTLYYRAMSRPGFEADRFQLLAMDLDDGDTHRNARRDRKSVVSGTSVQ